MSHVATTDTPNVVITSPNARRIVGGILYGISLLTGIASLTTAAFPELTTGELDPNRVITLVNAIVSLVSGSFGFAVTFPNVPKVLKPGVNTGYLTDQDGFRPNSQGL